MPYSHLKNKIPHLREQIKGKSIEEKMKIISHQISGGVVFSTSFGQEDQVITDIIFRKEIPVSVFTIDTGRLFEETYKTFKNTIEKYDKPIKTYFPKHESVEDLLFKKGPYSFYESVENRKECCYIRKVEPLQRALSGARCWVTGLRANQSAARQELQELSWDDKYNVIKYNPLIDWTLDDVLDYLKKHRVPYNPLHDKGFVSIGCEPCTRAVKPGEDLRAGRWWWEDNTKKECGLHEDSNEDTDNSLSNFVKKV